MQGQRQSPRHARRRTASGTVPSRANDAPRCQRTCCRRQRRLGPPPAAAPSSRLMMPQSGPSSRAIHAVSEQRRPRRRHRAAQQWARARHTEASRVATLTWPPSRWRGGSGSGPQCTAAAPPGARAAARMLATGRGRDSETRRGRAGRRRMSRMVGAAVARGSRPVRAPTRHRCQLVSRGQGVRRRRHPPPPRPLWRPDLMTQAAAGWGSPLPALRTAHSRSSPRRSRPR